MARGALFVLDRKIAQLARLQDLPREASREVAKEIERELNRTLGAGQAPDGSPWPPRKDTGGRPLQRARDRVRVGVVGSTIIVRLKDRATVLHHFGRGRGRVRREVIPSGNELPPAMADRVDAAVRRVVERILA